MKLVGVVRALGSCLFVLGCSVSHPGPESNVWLTFEQASAESRFVLSVTVDGRAGVDAQGPLVSDTRQAGQTARADLTPAEQQAMKDLITPALLAEYQMDAQTTGINTAASQERAYALFLDPDPDHSPAPQRAALGFHGDFAAGTATSVLLDNLHQTLVSVWSRGTKDGPEVHVDPGQ